VSERHATLRLRVTGFGSFPGVAHNPSADVVRMLAAHAAFFARQNIELETDILPVRYDVCDTLAARPTPDAAVHLGVASRRPLVSIETRATLRRSRRVPDASSHPPRCLANGDDEVRLVDADWDLHSLVTGLRQEGIPCAMSRDAGAYVCNALLYAALAPARAPALFIHVPRAEICAPDSIALALARVLPRIVVRVCRLKRGAHQATLAA
jgi:pyroglutamyl-peptidase